LVNGALTEYFATEENTTFENVDMNNEEITRLRSRIRAFAWCSKPSCSTLSELNYQLLLHQRGILQFIAIANDYNEIIILEVASPYQKMTLLPTEWNARVCSVVNLQGGMTLSNISTCSLPGLTPSRPLIHQIAWSSWAPTFPESRRDPWITLAYLSQYALKLKQFYLDLSGETLRLTPSDEVKVITGEHIGPLKWLRQVNPRRRWYSCPPIC